METGGKFYTMKGSLFLFTSLAVLGLTSCSALKEIQELINPTPPQTSTRSSVKQKEQRKLFTMVFLRYFIKMGKPRRKLFMTIVKSMVPLAVFMTMASTR